MSVSDSPFDTTLSPNQRATSCYYRVGALVTRGQRELAVEIIETEVRSAQHEVLLEAAKLVLSGEPIEIARQLRDRAETDHPAESLSPRPRDVDTCAPASSARAPKRVYRAQYPDSVPLRALRVRGVSRMRQQRRQECRISQALNARPVQPNEGQLRGGGCVRPRS